MLVPESACPPFPLASQRPWQAGDDADRVPRGVGARSARAPLGLVISEQTSAPSHRAYRGENRIRRLRKAIPEAMRCLTLAATQGGCRYRTAFVTLTYRPGAHWSPRHISELQEHYRKWLARRGHAYRGTWVMELTANGVPHYHLCIVLPRGITPPKPDKQGWWAHGLTRVEWARNPIGYLCKYVSKGTEGHHRIPKHARLYGVRGTGQYRPRFRHFMRPRWQRERFSQDDTLRRRPGGYFLHVQTGELLQSPYVIVARCPRWSWIEFAARGLPAADAVNSAERGS